MTRPDLEAILARWKKYGEEHDDIPALLAYIEELTRECDDRRRRCVMLARAHGALADAGCVVPTEMDETIEHAIEALAKERDDARAEVEKLSESAKNAWEAECIMRGQRDEARAELNFIREEYGRCENEKLAEDALALKIAVLTSERDAALEEVERLSRLENSLPASLRDAHVEVEHLRSQVTELTSERDDARAEADLLRGCNREHVWTWKTDGLTACAMCGMVQRADHANKPCRGVVRVGVRIEDERASAYHRGAEAMREACAQWLAKREGMSQWVYDDALRALPIPEDKP